MRMTRHVLAALACSLLLASAPCRANDAPWLEEVDAEDHELLERLLSPDEDVHAAAVEQWHEERIASLPEYGRDNFPPPPVDELSDDVDPNDSFAVRKKKMMTALVVALEMGSIGQRVAAAGCVQELAPASVGVIDALARALGDDAPAVRAAVIRALRGVVPYSGGKYVHKKLPAIVARIEDPSPEVRSAALQAAGTMIGSGLCDPALRERVVTLAIVAASDEDPDVRVCALLATRFLGEGLMTEVVEALLRGLDDDVPRVRAAAASALPHAQESRRALPRLHELLEDEVFETRYAAATSIWWLSGEPVALMPVMIEALSRFTGNDLAPPARVLTSIGPRAETATPELIRALGQLWCTRHSVTGNEIRQALESIGPSAEVALPALERELSRRPVEDRISVLYAVRTVYGNRARLAAWLRRMAKEVAFPADFQLEYLLASLGQETPDVIAWCKRRLASEDAWQRARGIGALARMESEVAVALLTEQLDDVTHRAFVLQALAGVGAPARGALPRLLTLLHDVEFEQGAATAIKSMGRGEDEEENRRILDTLEAVRSRADGLGAVALCDAVRVYGGEVETCLEMLGNLLEAENVAVRTAAAAAIGRWGAVAARALPRLQRMMAKGDTWHDGRAAALSAWQVGGEPGPTVDYLMRAVRNSHPPDAEAIRALGAMGSCAAEAVQLLTDAALVWRREFWKSERRTIAALDALGAIGRTAESALPVIRELERNTLFTKAARQAIERIESAEPPADEE